MLSVQEHKLTLSERQEVTLPSLCQILSAKIQGEDIILTVLAKESIGNQQRRIGIYENGTQIQEEFTDYISSFQVNELDFHVFDHGWV